MRKQSNWKRKTAITGELMHGQLKKYFACVGFARTWRRSWTRWHRNFICWKDCSVWTLDHRAIIWIRSLLHWNNLNTLPMWRVCRCCRWLSTARRLCGPLFCEDGLWVWRKPFRSGLGRGYRACPVEGRGRQEQEPSPSATPLSDAHIFCGLRIAGFTDSIWRDWIGRPSWACAA